MAGKTEKIALGTSVIDMLFHNPVILAKKVCYAEINFQKGDLYAGLVSDGLRMNTKHRMFLLKIEISGADEFVTSVKENMGRRYCRISWSVL